MLSGGSMVGGPRRGGPSSSSHLHHHHGRRGSVGCLPTCLSRLTVLASLLSLALLGASVATDRWIYTTEPLRTPNTTEDSCYTITFRSGLWKTCATVNWTNATTSTRANHIYAKCMAIPFWLTDMTSLVWKDADFTGSFLSGMRFSTVFISAGVVFASVAVLASLLGHCLQDVSTLVAAVLLILAGLSLGGGLLIYMTSLNTVYEEQAYYRKAIVDVRLYYSYGLSYYGACLALITEELSALIGLVAYLSRFRSHEDLLRLIPGVERRLRETSGSASDKQYIRMSKTDSNFTLTKAESRRTLKEDLTSETLTQIECVTVAL